MIIPSKFDGYGEGGRLTSTRRVYDGGGGGQPATQTQISDLPDWAKPSAQKLLGKAEAVTDISQNPYQPYRGERVAQFTPLQQQAFQGASTMNAGPEAFTQQVPQYMSPYMQNVIDREKLEAARASDLLGQQQQAQATQAGAFGGYREAIQRAERERGLRSQMGDIQTRGLQSAYDRAADQFRTGITQGLAVGQQQAQLGGQQQQQVQNVLNTNYQDFLNQQRYPYQQLEFMSNILRGTPMGTVNTLYGANPTTAQTLGALGMGAYGLSKVFAEGGSVTSDQNVESILSKLSDAQLRQARQVALSQRDMERVQMIDDELSERASMNNGLGGAFNQLSPEAQEGVFSAANGGVVALAAGGVGPVFNPPDPTKFYDEASRLSGELPAAVYTAPTQDEMAAGIRAQRALVQEMMGADKLTPFMEELAAQRQQLRGGSERDRGFAALAAIAPMLEGRGLASVGRGVSKFGAELGRLEKENRDADRLLLAAQTQLASAQQARADGQFEKASQLYRSGEELREKGLAAKRDVLGRQSTLQATLGGQALSAQSQKYGTDVQAATSRDVANINARTSAANAARPGETERIMEQINKIQSGQASFAGKTGDEGVKLYKQSLGEVGAARYGVGVTGERPATAANAATLENSISQAVRADPRSKPISEALAMAQMRVESYTRKGQPVPPEVQRRLETAQAQATQLREEHAARIRGGAPQQGAPAAPTASAPAAAARPSMSAWMAAARAANPGVSDAELKAYYERTYGGQ